MEVDQGPNWGYNAKEKKSVCNIFSPVEIMFSGTVTLDFRRTVGTQCGFCISASLPVCWSAEKGTNFT
jgi:hypothetical protein